MSWSVSLLGTPTAVAAALDAQSGSLSGASKDEFDAALPHLKALVLQNYLSDSAPGGYTAPLIDLDASGSGSSAQGKDFQRSCTVSVKPVWKKLLQ